ncbi:pentapeptide repeat-containing protein [Kribbella amoyensis]|uniref:pentapeptide repeat-containing protein n=1 Tax=Kribbella amoyensis TaxID=996641 RepID=UPI0014781BE5|nr:pentapeptide repeat-containing protein [Kribbella amoyensis]
MFGWLGGGDRPSDLAVFDGRADLRGFAAPDPSVLRNIEATPSIQASMLGGVTQLDDVHWEHLDLSYARLASWRFMNSSVEDCVFEGASCRDWRLWGSAVEGSSFEGADLRDAALGTWHDGRSNTWRDINFAGGDLRGVLFSAGRLEGCRFIGTRISGAKFHNVNIVDCVFSGRMQNVLFDGRKLQSETIAAPLASVDFTGASFVDVEFRGYAFSDVRLPSDVVEILNYPKVARHALEIVAGGSSVEDRMLAAEFRNVLKAPGSDDWTAIVNRADYVASGGEELADRAESVLRAAARQVR